MSPEEKWCRCGGEQRQVRQKLSQIIVTFLQCMICGQRTPLLEQDTQTNAFRELLLPKKQEDPTGMPRSLRHRRLQSSTVPEGTVHKVLGYDQGWTQVALKSGREAWVAPGGNLMLEALD